MIECIFTLDYEIYGNGSGSLRELVYEPAERLKNIFIKRNARFVNFVEVAELEKLDEYRSDWAIEMVKEQIKDLYQNGFEIGLHLHPQWCNARYENSRWVLDAGEYNLCTLSRARISQIVQGALDYLRSVLGQEDFTPLSFRAGNWLFQPTQAAAEVLADYGIKIDSSVFKGGVQHNHGLNYRPAKNNGRYWNFSKDVNRSDPAGVWTEVPIYTEMVPFWKMLTTKRMGLGAGNSLSSHDMRHKINRARDFLRFHYPMKLDFCRMTLNELTGMLNKAVREDKNEPERYWPIVAIGHTKDLNDPRTVDDFLGFLQEKGISVSTLEAAFPNLSQGTETDFTRPMPATCI